MSTVKTPRQHGQVRDAATLNAADTLLPETHNVQPVVVEPLNLSFSTATADTLSLSSLYAAGQTADTALPTATLYSASGLVSPVGIAAESTLSSAPAVNHTAMAATDASHGVVHAATVNTAASLTMDAVSGDNAVSYQEGIYGLVFTGHASGLAADTPLSVTLGGKHFDSFVNADGSWHVSLNDQQLATLSDGVYSAVVTATSASGQLVSASSNVTLITHLASIPNVTFDNVTSDNVINIAESQQGLVLTGHLSTHSAPGQSLTIASAGGLDSMKEYAATIHSDGSWSVAIPAAEMANFIDGDEHRLVATTSDAAGNHNQVSFEFSTQLQLPEVYYELDIGGDLTLSHQEAQHDMSFYIDGVQSIDINGKSYTPTDGMVTVPSADLLALPDGPVNATVHQADSYGNSATQTLSNFFTAATHGTQAAHTLSAADLGLQHTDSSHAALMGDAQHSGDTSYYQPVSSTLADLLTEQHIQATLI